MKPLRSSMLAAWCLVLLGNVNGQGKHLNPEAQREMDKPVITASSTLPPGSSSTYSPDNLMDGTMASWSEGAKGSGVGEYLQVDFRFPDEMKYVMVKNGFGKEKYWKANARIKEFEISNEAGDTRVIVLEDTPDLQVVGLNNMEQNADGFIESSGGLEGSSFKFTISEVFPGERWQDACLTEMNFNLWHTDWFPMSEEYIFKNLLMVHLDGVFDVTGALYIESDWDGYIEISVDDGYYFNEIVSGDGTTGHENYQAYINTGDGEYYLLYSRYMRELDFEHIDFNEADQEDPAWMEYFSWQLMKYESFDDAFEAMKMDDILALFDVDPLKVLKKSSQAEVGIDDIWITLDTQGNLKLVYPQSLRDIKAAVNYEWDGSQFIMKD